MVSACRLGEVVAGSLPNRTTTVTMGVATRPMENFVLDWIPPLIAFAVMGFIAYQAKKSWFKEPATDTGTQPENQTVNGGAGEPADLPILGNASLMIRYRDSSNQESERRITPRKVRGVVSSGRLQISHIEAYCHSRKRARTFKPERILQAADADTGEVLALPDGLAKWLQPRISA
jgi:hypothetical protein